MYKVLTVYILCLYGVRSQIPYLGKCPNVTVQENFDLSKYIGKWYESYKYFTIFELFGKCIQAEYTSNENGTVKVRNSQISRITGRTMAIVGNARPGGSAKEGKLVVRFSFLGIYVDAPYWVLETDYETYSVVWSCTNFLIINTRFAWILTREKNPPDAVIAKAYDVLDKFKLSKRFLTHTDQSKCPDMNN